MSNSQIRPFVEWLGDHKKGEVDTELTHQLRELIATVQEVGKPGTLTLTLKVSRKGERQVTIVEDVKAKLPLHARAESIYFVDQNDNLTRNDPRQGVLTPLKRDKASGGDE